MSNDEIVNLYLQEGQNYATVAEAAGLPISDVIRICTMKSVIKRMPNWWENERKENRRRKMLEQYHSTQIEEED